MLRNYLKLSIRRLRQNAFFSVLQVGGLALGIAAALLLWTYTRTEWSFNRYHTQAKQLYRVLLVDKDGVVTDYTPPALGPWLKRQFPEVNHFMRANQNSEGVVSSFGTNLNEDIPRKAFREAQGIAYADGSIFRMFTFEPNQGKLQLDRAQEVALSATYARKYFGEDDPLGMTIKLDNQFGSLPYTVVGVYEDMPVNSDYRFDLIFSLKTLENPANLNGNDWAALDTWYSYSYATFIGLQVGSTVPQLERKANAGLKQLFPDLDARIRLQALTEMHLGANNEDPNPTFGNRSLILALGAITLLILLIAWINYINIATAQGYQQSQNVGIRRTVGAPRLSVALQYFIDSLLLTILALILSIPLVALFRPQVNLMVGRSVDPFALLNQGNIWLFVLGILLGTSLAGAYVAWLLSGVKPIQMLNKANTQGQPRVLGRNVLVVTQFAIAILFIIGALVVEGQLSYMRHKSLGMDLDQLLVIRGPEVGAAESRSKNLNVLRSELQKLSWVEDFCFTGALPGSTFTQNFQTEGFSSAYSGADGPKKSYVMAMVDHLYQPTYGISLAAGENFSEKEASEGYTVSAVVLLNETAARQLGFSQPTEAAGQQIKWNDQTYLVKGVLQDYHHRGLQQAIDPMIFLPARNSYLISIRLSTDNMGTKLNQLQRLYTSLFPAEPYEYFFEKEDFDKQYLAEERQGRVASSAAIMAILLSCLGLLGLITHSIGRRTKEIGIRKVLGASIASITGSLTVDFLKLVLVALLVASPVAWYVMNQWLGTFAYRIQLQWWFFVVAGAVALLIAFVTVSIQSVRAAMTNPVDVLKSE